jgi:hemin uptake protein HemP
MTLHSRDAFTPAECRHLPQMPAVPVHRAEDLTRGGSLANIVLSGQTYALRITRAGKLILTK